MNMPAKEGLSALTEKEKQTLRLIVRGHDAKSTARSLGLSVHTINERLRDARRKLAVSSSREAARILLQADGIDAAGPIPDLSGDAEIGEDTAHSPAEQESTPTDGAGRRFRRPWIIIGGFLMTFALGLLLLAVTPQSGSTPTSTQPASAEAPDAQAVETARQWLGLLDQANWTESYRATGAAFQKLNTVEAWAAASEKARLPLGKMLTRTFLSQENLPAPPAGYEVMKFRTRFANQAEAIETVTLDREDGRWRVVGVTIG
ncbi:DUF4019 domain-containing protein [Sphingomonas arantia]|uniref:DUF4019 domain-containing protein n=1 Tax=Sphingomonas arantia TaxID=1460676 RepID=A0ABW4TZH6_9SPHN